MCTEIREKFFYQLLENELIDLWIG